MANYLKQLTADLPRWVAAGYITPTASQQMLADVKSREGQGWFKLPTVLAALGGVLVFVGIISWVASNWNDIPRLTRVALLLAGMAGSFMAAHVARAKQAEGISAAFAMLGALIFGANLMLIAQIYNLPPNPPGGALLWALGAALTAVLWPSQLVMALAFVLAGVWTWFAAESGSGLWGLVFAAFSAKTVHLPFLLLWGALAAYSIKQGWNKAMHFAGVTLVFWLGVNVLSIFGEAAMRFGGLIALAVLLALAAAGRALNIAREGTGTISRYMMVGFSIWLLVVTVPEAFRYIMYHKAQEAILQGPVVVMLYTAALLAVLCVGLWGAAKDRLRTLSGVAVLAAIVPLLALLPTFFIGADASTSGVRYVTTMASSVQFVGNIFLSILVLGAAIAAIIQGYRSNDRFLLNIGFIMFALKLLMLYFDTVWSLNARAGFFIGGGLLTIGLSVLFEKQRRKLLAKMEVTNV